MTVDELLSPPMVYVLIAFALLVLGAGVVLIESTVRHGIDWSPERRQRDLIEEAVHTAYRDAAEASRGTPKGSIAVLPVAGSRGAPGAARKSESHGDRSYGVTSSRGATGSARSSSRAAPPS